MSVIENFGKIDATRQYVAILNANHAEDIRSPKNKEIFEYVKERRKGRFEKVGVIIGVDVGGIVKVSFSKCNDSVGDKFNVFEGMKIARDRILGVTKPVEVPLCMERQIRQFCSRAFRYFKGVKKVEIV